MVDSEYFVVSEGGVGLIEGQSQAVRRGRPVGAGPMPAFCPENGTLAAAIGIIDE